jgi:hypothetical protein
MNDPSDGSLPVSRSGSEAGTVLTVMDELIK